jgi:uncharacterized Zn finger protein
MGRYDRSRRDRYRYGGFAPYVSVAERQRRAAKELEELRKTGVEIEPVGIPGRIIAKSFWGKGWCDHMESFRDYSNRLDRGKTYARNGSVCHMTVSRGRVDAKVAGSELYDVSITIKALPAQKWEAIKKKCHGQIGSLIELLQGKLSDEVMGVVTQRKEGLFPDPSEITMRCSCPDSARMCKHIAAVIYGVGSRLDHKPEVLFVLRGVNHEELIQENVEQELIGSKRGKSKRLAASSLEDVFGIELGESDESEVTATPKPRRKAAKKKASKKKTNAKTKSAKKKVVRKKLTKKAAPIAEPEAAELSDAAPLPVKKATRKATKKKAAKKATSRRKSE